MGLEIKRERERGWRQEGQTLRSSERADKGMYLGQGFFATVTEVVLKWLEMRTLSLTNNLLRGAVEKQTHKYRIR